MRAVSPTFLYLTTVLLRSGCFYTSSMDPRKAPRRVSLQTLSHVTVLVDKHELHEVAEFVTDSWFEMVERRGMTEYEHRLDELF